MYNSAKWQLEKELKRHRVENPAAIPTNPHVAVMVFSTASVTIPGDERSQRAPGHGYPEHTEHYKTFEYYAFTNHAQAVQYMELLFEDDPDRTDVALIIVEKKVEVKAKLIVDLKLG